MAKKSFDLRDRPTRKKRLKIVLAGVLLVLVLIGAWTASIYRQKFQASSLFDSTFESSCRTSMKLPAGTTKIPALLKDAYGKDYPGLQPVSDYSVDLDTYAASWRQLPNSNRLLYDYKAKLPNIIGAIRTIYGEPFQKHQVVVVVVPDLENSQYNEWQLNDLTGQYRPDLNLILLSEQGANDPVAFIHETIHSFNHGTIISDAYEEGLVESAAIRIAQALQLPTGSQHAFDTDNRPDLSVAMGYFRTSDNSNTTDNRYDAAAKFFGALYDKDQNFYKTFRANLKSSTYFNEIIADSKKFGAERLIGASICGDLMYKPQYNVMRPYVADLQNVLLKSLPADVRASIKSSDMTLHPFQNFTTAQSINIYPENKLYNNLAFYPNADRVFVYSSYKRNDLLEIFYEYYKQFNAQDENQTNYVNMAKIQGFSATIATDDNSVLNKFTKLLETAPDQTVIDLQPQTTAADRTPGKPTYRSTYPICVASSDPKGVNKTCPGSLDKVLPNSSSDNEVVSYNSASLLSETKLPSDFTGNINVTISSSKKIWVVTPKRGHAGGVWPFTQVVWPDGLTASPKNITEVTMSVVSFVNGKISSVAPASKQAVDSNQLEQQSNSTAPGGRGPSGRVIVPVENITAATPAVPTVKTAEAGAISEVSAALTGNIIPPSSGATLPITTIGFKYGTSITNLNNSIAGSYVVGSTTQFSANITSGLEAGGKYYFEAYAINSVGTGLGSVASFTTARVTTINTTTPPVTTPVSGQTTAPPPPAVASTVSAVSAVMNNVTSATFTAKVTNTGNAKIAKRGFLYGLVGQESKAVDTYDTGSFGTGQFSKTPALKANTRYWVQAYAENSAGKRIIGDTLTNFKMTCTAPTVSTDAVTNITTNSAAPHGTINSIGSMAITKRGFQWGYSTSSSGRANSYPLTFDSVAAVPFTTGRFTKYPSISSLTKDTTYQIRAYVYSKCGPSYGNWVQFKTQYK